MTRALRVRQRDQARDITPEGVRRRSQPTLNKASPAKAREPGSGTVTKGRVETVKLKPKVVARFSGVEKPMQPGN